MPLKIAMIGAGSIGFTRRLMHDILAVPEFADTTFAFMDIDPVQPGYGHPAHASAISKPTACRPKSSAPLDRREAIQDCDYVICMIRQGRLEAFQLDIDIPLKYGVDQCVGDTICAGGIMYAQRTIPELLGLLQRYPRGGQTGCAVPELLQPHGDEHLGLQQIWRGEDHRPVPRRAGRPLADHRMRGNVGQEPGPASRPMPNCTAARWTSSPPASTTRPGSSRSSGAGIDMMPLPAGAVPTATRYTTRHRKGAHRRAAPLWLLLAPNPTATSASTCPGTASDRTRSRSGSTCLPGSTARPAATCACALEGPQLVRDRFPQLADGDAALDLKSGKRSEEHGSYIIEGLETGRHLPRAFQRGQPRPHHQPAGWLRGRNPRLRRPHRHQYAGGGRSAPGLRRHLLGHAHRCRKWAWKPPCTAT